jgi:tRNA G37 N-methylase TrmD
MFDGLQTNSIMKRALGKGVDEIEVINIRDYTTNKYG